VADSVQEVWGHLRSRKVPCLTMRVKKTPTRKESYMLDEIIMRVVKGN
jgi:hypothetical protein